MGWPELIYKSTVTSLNVKLMQSCAVVVLFHSLQWRHVEWSTGNTTGQLAHSRVLDPASSVVSFQLRPSWSSESLLNCERRVPVVMCQVPKKYLTWVNSMYNRTQKRFLRNHRSVWKRRFCVCVCILGEPSIENRKLKILRKLPEPGSSHFLLAQRTSR